MKNLIKSFYANHFKYKGEERLSKITMFFILILDIIVFGIIIEGVDFQANFVNSPRHIYPANCSSIVTADLTNFSSYYYKKAYKIEAKNYYEDFDTSSLKKEEMDKRCQTLNDKLQAVKVEHNIEELVDEKNNLQKKQYSIEDELNYLRKNYNTILFEKIASQEAENSLIEGEVTSKNIKQKYDTKVEEFEKIKASLDSMNRSFINSKSVQDLITYKNSIKEEYLNDESSAFIAYFYKVEFVKLLFLLPLVLAFFYLMKKYLQKDRYTLYIIFKNILIVALLPTIFVIFSIVYKLLPKVFLAQLIEFFYNLKIPFIAYYLLIAIFILAFILIIVKLQKRFKEQDKINSKNQISRIKFYNQSLCYICKNRVSYINMNFCPICQNKLKIECKECKSFTINGLNYCQNCGNTLIN